MADNISVKITADVVDLQAKFSIAKAESSAFTAELSKLARQAASTGLTDTLKAQLDAAAQSALQAKSKVADLSAQLKEAQGSGSAFSAAIGEANSMLGQFGAAMSIAAAVGFGKSALEYAADTEHMANVLGLTSEELQAFQFAARESGTSTDDADTMLRRFMANMGALQDNTGPAVKAVEDLGLTVDELSGPPAIALQKIATALLGIQDPTRRAHDEVEIFGRSGLDLNAMLSKLSQGLDAMAAAASASGQMMDPKLTKAAEDSENALAGFWAGIKGDGATALVGLGQDIQEIIDLFHQFGDAADQGEIAARRFAMGVEDAFTQMVQKKTKIPATAGGLPMDMQKPQMPDAGAAPTIDIVDPKKAEEEARKAAEIARRLSDEIAQDSEALSLKQISAAESANNFALSMGDESLDQWKAKAVEESDAKLAAELKYLNAKAAADKGNVVEEQKDLDQIRLAHQEHANALQQIDQQYAEKKRAIAQEELSEFISADNAKLQDGIRALEEEYRTHQITAQQRYTLEQQLTQEIYSEELKRLDTLLATLTQGTKAYEDAIKQREKIEQEFTKQSQANTSQLETEEAAKWTQLGNSIKSSFNSAIDGMLFQGRTFGQGMVMIAEGVAKAFLEMGEKMLEDWVVTQLEQLVITKTTGTEQATSQITSAAAVAGAQGTASFAGAPWPIDMGAPEFGASMSAAALAYSSMLSLDVGAWDMKSDSIAQLHKGEMVVPENFASGLRGKGGAIGGGDVNMHYGPTIHAREPATLSQMLSRESGEMLSWLNRQFRNGAIRA